MRERIMVVVLCALLSVRRRYGIDWSTEGRWYSIGRTWWTKRGALRACRRVLRDVRCGAARVVIVLTPVEGCGQPARYGIWSDPARYARADR